MKLFYTSYIYHNVPFYIFSGIAILLLVASWFVPPIGEINSSVLIATSEIFAFAALWTVIQAIDKGMSASITKGDTSLEITKNNIEEKE